MQMAVLNHSCLTLPPPASSSHFVRIFKKAGTMKLSPQTTVAQGMFLTAVLALMLTGCFLPYEDVDRTVKADFQISKLSPKVGEEFEVKLSLDYTFTDPKKYRAVLMTETPTAQSRPMYAPGVDIIPIRLQIDVLEPVLDTSRSPVIAPFQVIPPVIKPIAVLGTSFKIRAVQAGVVSLAIGILTVNPLSATGYDDTNQPIYWGQIVIQP
jgi:hypothetical protein